MTELLKKEDIILAIEDAIGDKTDKGRNRMGVSESRYNPYCLVGNMLKDKDISVDNLTEKELNYMVMVADFASDAFY